MSFSSYLVYLVLFLFVMGCCTSKEKNKTKSGEMDNFVENESNSIEFDDK